MTDITTDITTTTNSELSAKERLDAILKRQQALQAEAGIQPAGELFDKSEHSASTTYTPLPGGVGIASTLGVNTIGSYKITPGVAEGEKPDYTKSMRFFRKVGEELVELPMIVQVGGYFLGNVTVPTLSYKEGNEPSKTVCQVIGRTTVSQETGEQVGIRLLPNTPIPGMYKYEETNRTYREPHTKLPGTFLGNRGMTCRECIKSGNSVIYHEGKDRPTTCSAISYVYIYVDSVAVLTEVKVDGQGKPICKGNVKPEGLVEKVQRDFSGKVSNRSYYHLTAYKVKDLLNEDGELLEPFILSIRITALGNQGAWNQGVLSLSHCTGALSRIDEHKSMADYYTTILLTMKEKSEYTIPDFSIYDEDGTCLYSRGKGEPYTILSPQLAKMFSYDVEKSLTALEAWMKEKRPDDRTIIDIDELKRKSNKGEAPLKEVSVVDATAEYFDDEDLS